MIRTTSSPQAGRLENPAIAMNGGLELSESDPQFHQQMVYASASETMKRFDGDAVELFRGPRLPAMPRLLALRSRAATVGLFVSH
jgi:hypothetical protein